MEVLETCEVSSTFFYVFLVSFIETSYLCYRKNSRIDWIGKLIKLYEIPRQASLLNGGPRPSG